MFPGTVLQRMCLRLKIGPSTASVATRVHTFRGMLSCTTLRQFTTGRAVGVCADATPAGGAGRAPRNVDYACLLWLAALYPWCMDLVYGPGVRTWCLDLVCGAGRPPSIHPALLGASKTQIMTSPPFSIGARFQLGPKSGFEMCFAPSTDNSRCWWQTTSRIRIKCEHSFYV